MFLDQLLKRISKPILVGLVATALSACGGSGSS